MFLKRAGIWPFLALAIVLGFAALLARRADLPPSYHHFADQRIWLGIPHFGDVVSNIAFLVAGLWGLAFLSKKSSLAQFIDARERWPYFLMFLGLVLTAFGSAYYHLAPDNARLVWDRLPMTIVFMPLVAALVAERVNVKLGLWLLPVLIAVGIGSVIQWHLSVEHGAGDLRFFVAVQVYAVLALLAALLLPPRYTRGLDLLVVAGLLRARENLRNGGPSDFLGRALPQRTHTQTPFCRHRGFLDFENAPEEAATRGSLNAMSNTARADSRNRPTLEAPSIER